ncbi:MAG: DNA polymerase III subunit delta [Eubacterium sp.]|nr:DNA polymerase III subunit delta [Eubacterium sp.]
MLEIARDIKEKHFRRLYLLYGSEDYLRRQYRQKLLAALVPEEDTMNMTRFSGKEADVSAIISQAETLPFFAERRVILAEDTELFKKGSEELATYLKDLPDYLVLIFSEKEVDKRTRLFKAASKAGHAADFSPPDEKTLVRWIRSRFSEEGKQISGDAAMHLLSSVGTEMSLLDQEMQKLTAWCAGKESVTKGDIDTVCVSKTENRIFDMIRAITQHRRREALDLYYDLLALREPPMRILYLMFYEYNRLFQIGALSDEGVPQRDIASRLGIRPFAVSKAKEILPYYPQKKLKEILEFIAGLEEDMKQGRLDDKLCVELAITKLSEQE